MNRKWIAIVLTAVALQAVSITGCSGTPTPESIANKALSKLQDVDSYSSEMSYKVKGDFIALGITADYEFGFDVTEEKTVGNQSSRKDHLQGNYYYTFSDATAKESKEEYTETDENEKKEVTYTSVNNGDWERSEEKLPEEEYDYLTWGDAFLYEWISDGDVEAKLSEETEQVNGEDCYVLTFSLNGDQIEKFLNHSIFSKEEMDDEVLEDSDTDSFSGDVKLYVYKETGLTARMELNSKDLGQAIMDSSIADSSFASEYSSLFGTEKADILSTKIDECELIIDNLKYNDVDEIKIPEEVKNAKEVDSSDTQNSLSEASAENLEKADSDTPVHFKKGTFEDGIYTNETANLRIDLGQNWTTYTDSELAQVNGMDEDDFTNETISDYLADGNLYYDFAAVKADPLNYLEIDFWDLYSIIGPVTVDEQVYCNAAVHTLIENGSIKSNLENLGLTDVTVEKTEVNVFNRTLSAVSFTGTLSGTEIRGYFIPMVEEDRFLTRAFLFSESSDEVDSILDSFEEIEPNESSEADTDSSQQGNTESSSTVSTSAS